MRLQCLDCPEIVALLQQSYGFLSKKDLSTLQDARKEMLQEFFTEHEGHLRDPEHAEDGSGSHTTKSLPVWYRLLGVCTDASVVEEGVNHSSSDRRPPNTSTTTQVKMDVEALLSEGGLPLCGLGDEEEEPSPRAFSNLVEELVEILYEVCDGLDRPYACAWCELCSPVLRQLASIPIPNIRGQREVVCRFLHRLATHGRIPNMDAPTSSFLYLSDVHRLLLQYHDPVLSLHLDHTQKYPRLHQVLFGPSGWHATLFTTLLSRLEIVPLWDFLLVWASGNRAEDGRCAALFVGLALLTICSEELQTLTSHSVEDYDCTIMRRQLRGADVAKEAYRLMMITPRSVVRDVCYHLSSTYSEEITKEHMRLRHFLLLPVDATDVVWPFLRPDEDLGHQTLPSYLRASPLLPSDPPRYTVLDCRSEMSFNFAHIPNAVHIGTNVTIDPVILSQVVQRFLPLKGCSLLAILGTGKNHSEEIGFLNVLCLEFLRAGFPQVSFIDGGFQTMVPALQAKRLEYVQTFADRACVRVDEGNDPSPFKVHESQIDSASESAEHTDPASAGSEGNLCPPTSEVESSSDEKTRVLAAETIKTKIDSFMTWGADFLCRRIPSSVAPEAMGCTSTRAIYEQDEGSSVASRSFARFVQKNPELSGIEEHEEEEEDEYALITELPPVCDSSAAIPQAVTSEVVRAGDAPEHSIPQQDAPSGVPKSGSGLNTTDEEKATAIGAAPTYSSIPDFLEDTFDIDSIDLRTVQGMLRKTVNHSAAGKTGNEAMSEQGNSKGSERDAFDEIFSDI